MTNDENKERLLDALSDLADHTSQALRDAANGKAASATVNVELAKGDAERVERITQDMENDNG